MLLLSFFGHVLLGEDFNGFGKAFVEVLVLFSFDPVLWMGGGGPVELP
jgi:hypothetical protein